MMRYFRNAYYICPYRLVVFVELSYMFATKLSLELNYDCTHTYTHTHTFASRRIYMRWVYSLRPKKLVLQRDIPSTNLVLDTSI